MCTVSMISDDWTKRNMEFVRPWYHDPGAGQMVVSIPQIMISVPKEEYEKLKKDVEELKTLLLAAKKYDESTGQPDCEMEEKVNIIKKIAEYLGVDMKGVFNNHV